jgi:tetratricopeptide (TPR) repeat protein
VTGPQIPVRAAPAAPAAELLGIGRAALAAGAWADARQAFEALLEREPEPEALAGLGDALWWLGETESAIACQERAYAAYRRRPDPLQSGLAAISLFLLYRVSLGNTAAARGCCPAPRESSPRLISRRSPAGSCCCVRMTRATPKRRASGHATRGVRRGASRIATSSCAR